MNRLLPGVAAFIAVASVSPAFAAELKKDIEYSNPGGESLKLDVCIPDGKGPFPAAILVHGGGWASGNKTTGVSPIFEPLTKAGIVWVSVDYRLAPQNRHPACVEDVEAAVRWVKAHAKEYNIDPARIALVGESAGGHIVDMVAVRAKEKTADTAVAAIVTFYAPCDNVADTVRRNGPSLSMQQLLGVPPGMPMNDDTTKRLRDISPLNFTHKNLPPYLLIHGTADQSVPYDQSERWQANLKILGVPCELITIKDGPHVMARWETLDTSYKERLTAWLLKTLAPPPKSPAASARDPKR